MDAPRQIAIGAGQHEVPHRRMTRMRRGVEIGFGSARR